LPNESNDGLMANCACVDTAVPLSPIESGEPAALLVTETAPDSLPVVVGANVALKVAVCPGVSVCAARVLMLKPVPLVLAPLIATFEVPLFVSVTVTEELAPVRRLPKLMLAGFAVKAPWVPVPLREIKSVGLVAVEFTVMLPDAVPAAAGANFAVSVAVPPALID
jgi:hypothetical protein